MKFTLINSILVLSLLVPPAEGHSLITNDFQEETTNLRGGNRDMLMTADESDNFASLSGVVRNSISRHDCAVEYIEQDGTVVCNRLKNPGTEVIVDGCSINEELVIRSDGTARCRRIKTRQRKEIIVDRCGNNEELVVNSYGSVRCRKIKKGRVVTKKKLRKNKNRAIVYVDDDVTRRDVIVVDDDDDQVRVVRRNGRKKHKVVYVDDDDDVTRSTRNGGIIYHTGNLPWGAECTHSLGSCMLGYICSRSTLPGDHRWICQ